MVFSASFWFILWKIIMMMVWFQYFFQNKFLCKLHYTDILYLWKNHKILKQIHPTCMIFFSQFLKNFTKKIMRALWFKHFFWNYFVLKLPYYDDLFFVAKYDFQCQFTPALMSIFVLFLQTYYIFEKNSHDTRVFLAHFFKNIGNHITLLSWFFFLRKIDQK